MFVSTFSYCHICRKHFSALIIQNLISNSKEECEKLDLIKIRVLNVITMEREGKKGFEGDVREQL